MAPAIDRVSALVETAVEGLLPGVYLLFDPDFEAVDTVTLGDMTGEVAAIELRKRRFDVEGVGWSGPMPGSKSAGRIGST